MPLTKNSKVALLLAAGCALLVGGSVCCFAGMVVLERSNSTASAGHQEGVQANPALPPPSLAGCWFAEQNGGFTECFNPDGTYSFAVMGRAVSVQGAWALSDSTLSIGYADGRSDVWRVSRLDASVLELVAVRTLAGRSGAIVSYVRRPNAAPDTTASGVASDRLIGCWRRTSGNTVECYLATGAYATRRDGVEFTGIWRRGSGETLLLTLDLGTFVYGLVWEGNDRVTFVGENGSQETFVRTDS